MKKKLLALSVLAAVSSQANAFQLDTGDDWSIRWDTTFKGNIMFSFLLSQNTRPEPHSAYTGWLPIWPSKGQKKSGYAKY